MPMRENQFRPGYGDPGETYALAGANIAEALFGNKAKAGEYRKAELENRFLEAKIRQQELENAAGGDITKKRPFNPQEMEGVPALVNALYAAQPGMEGFEISKFVPPQKLLDVGRASETAYQRNRSQYEAAQEMINALGIPAGAKIKKGETRWFGPNDPDVLLGPSGTPYNFGMPELTLPQAATPAPETVEPGFMEQLIGALSAAPSKPITTSPIQDVSQAEDFFTKFRNGPAAAPVQAAPAGPVIVRTPQEAAALPPGTQFIGADGKLRVRP